MEVFFCDRCSTRVTEGDLAEDRAFQLHTFILCKECWDNSEVREAIERRVAESSAAAKTSSVSKRRPGTGRHPAHRKTPRPTNSGRRTPAKGAPRRTPVPKGRRRTPGRTTPVRDESSRQHSVTSRRHSEAPSSVALPKALAFAALGLAVGLLAIFFMGAKKDPAVSGARSNATVSSSGGASNTGNAATTIEPATNGGSGTTRTNRGGGMSHLVGGVDLDDGSAGRDGDDNMQDPLYESATNVANASPGLKYEMFEGSWEDIPDFDKMAAAKTGQARNFKKVGSKTSNYGLRFKGYIDISRKGLYTFVVKSDDGARLYIGAMRVVDNAGTHGAQEMSGSAYLKAGKHAIRLDYFQGGGGEYLEVKWSGPGLTTQEIPAGVLYHAGG